MLVAGLDRPPGKGGFNCRGFNYCQHSLFFLYLSGSSPGFPVFECAPGIRLSDVASPCELHSPLFAHSTKDLELPAANLRPGPDFRYTAHVNFA